MTSLLLTISLILHLFTFFWIINLMQKINLKPTDSREIEKIKSEIEDVLLAYTTEMKDENEKLVIEMKKLKLNNNQIIKRMEKKEEEILEIPKPIQSQPVPKPINRATNAYTSIPYDRSPVDQVQKDSYDEYAPPLIEDETKDDLIEQSDTAKVLSLAEQGFNAEQIAKKLKLGKGEVELVLKFYR